MKSIKICAGEYEISINDLTVRVFKHEFIGEWIAAAEWDSSLTTDPLPTKAHAVFNARLMLEDANG